MNAAPNHDLKDHILDLARRFLALERDAGEDKNHRKRMQPYIDGLERGVFRLVVVGEVKKGKSSFVNALLGIGDLLPIDIDVATSVVYKILYGPAEKITVFFLDPQDESESRKPCSITRDELPQFGTESGNPGNAKDVDFIAIELPSPLLREGIVIIDTPGVGGLFKKHRDITFRYTPDANAVLFIVDSVEAPIGGADSDSPSGDDAETKFLAELKKSTDQIIFIQTKIDAAGPEQRDGYRQRNLDILVKLLERPASRIPYFLVSSTLKALADQHVDSELLNDSGFLAVLQFLQEVLIPRRNAILAGQLAQMLSPEVAAEGHSVLEHLAIAQETDKPKLAEYRKQLTAAEKQYETWIGEQWPIELRMFQDRFADIKKEAAYSLQDTLCSESTAFTSRLDLARQNCTSPEKVVELGPASLADYAAECNQHSRRILDKFVAATQTAYISVLKSGTDALSDVRVPQLQVEPGQVRATNSGRLDALRSARQNWVFIGGMTESAAGAVGWTAAAATVFGLVSNPIGWTVAATAGVTAIATKIWSTVRGYKAARQNQVAAAIANLERAMQTTSQRALRTASRVLQDLAVDLERTTRDGFDEFKSRTKSQFTKRTNELRDAETRSAADSEKIVSGFNSRLRALEELARELKNIISQPAES